MIGFADDVERSALISDSPRRWAGAFTCSKTASVAWALALVSVGASLGVLARQSTTSEAFVLAPLLASEESGEACATKAFQQCGGMNFSSVGTDGFNFSASAPPFACCPEGTACVAFGPVWAMCMPQWGAARVDEMLTTLAQLPRLPDTVTAAAAAAPTGAVDRAPSSKTPLADKPAEDPCANKPFGQCAGMNFTQTKEERDAYNFTAGAAHLSCCPAGTSCVVFGPVWGMCMPSWSSPAAPTRA